MPTVVRNIVANWYTPAGAVKMYSRLVKRGLPSFLNWRFITLTLDPSLFVDAEEGYHESRERMRYFVRTVRSDLGLKSLAHLWKLEFTEKGWAHYHLLLKYFRPIPVQRLTTVWRIGRVDIRQVKKDSFSYLFKYICKDASTELPAWFLKLHKPKCFSSKGVFPSVQNSERVGGKRSTGRKKPVDLTLGKRLERDEKSAFVYHDDQEELYPEKVQLAGTFDQMRNDLVVSGQAKFGNSHNELRMSDDLLDGLKQ